MRLEQYLCYNVLNASGTATSVLEAFDKAGIPFQWKKMPFKRQLITIKANKNMACGIGAFKNPEREAYAHFSDMPAGNMRYLACSQQVPFKMIERVNDYLK